jgi:hypothetical protein
MLRDDFIHDYLVLILWILVSIDSPRTLLILTISSSLWVLMRGTEAEFIIIFDRSFWNYFKKIFKG